jgi:hypothetical protein
MTLASARRLWTPDRLGGAVSAWFDASDASTLALSGSTVTTWHDRSRNAQHITSTGSPTWSASAQNGKGAVTLNGSGQYFSAIGVTIPASLDFACYAAMAPGASGGTYRCLYDNATNSPMVWNDTASKIEANTSTAASGISSTATCAGAWNVYAMIERSLGANLQEVRFNGASAGTRATNNLTAGAQTLTMFNRAAANGWLGTVGELIFTNRFLGDDAINKLEGYLAWKWGLRWLLPATHPYLNSAP